MKIYIKTLLIFILTFAIGVVLRVYLQRIIPGQYVEASFKLYLLLSFSLVISICIKERSLLFQRISLGSYFWILLVVLLLLFGINNYLMVRYSTDQYYSETLKAAVVINTISYLISSIAEEVVYRGFVQTYINENTTSNSFVISKGNLFATILFFLSHIAFFTVMDKVFAITSLINVLVFSLIAGYLLERTKNIVVPVVLHVVINLLHIFIQVKF
jgi:membrane protease YdiL (CAAX protease family)